MRRTGLARTGWVAGAAGVTGAFATLGAGPALAADPPAVVTGDGGPVTLLLVLLLGSLTAGLFFASPLRRRFVRAGPMSSAATPSALRQATPPSVRAVASGLGQLGDRVHASLARATSRWPQMQTATPLPPMLGGDLFFEEPDVEPEPDLARWAPAPAPSSPDGWPIPWSTAPLSPERYGPFR